MNEFLGNPSWQGVGAIFTLIIGLLGFYYSGKNRVWIYLSVGIVILLIGIGIGIGSKINTKSQSPTESPTKYPIPTPEITIAPFDSLFLQQYTVQSYKGDAAGQVIDDFLVKHHTSGDSWYQLLYALPDKGEGYSAGLSFRFEPKDLTAYKFLEINIVLDKTQCDLIVRDIGQKTSQVRLGEVSSDSSIVVITQGSIHTIKIPITNHFLEINPTTVVEIAFEVNSKFQRGTGFFYIINILLWK